MKAYTTLSQIMRIVVLSALPLASQAAEPPKTAEVPEWALGVLTFPQLGMGLQKTSAYANHVLLNSGQLANQIIMNALFKLPMSAEFPSDRPASIYLLNPLSMGLGNETACVLPISDAKAFKAEWVNALGAPAEDHEVMTFTIPQPLPNPDKFLVAKFTKEGKVLLVAPSHIILKSLEDWTNRPGDAIPIEDVVLTLKVANIKRDFGALALGSLEYGAAMAAQNPQQGERLKVWMNDILNALWSMDVVRASLKISQDGSTAGIEISACASPDAPLPTWITISSSSAIGLLAGEMPTDAALKTFFSINGRKCADWLDAQFLPAQANAPDSAERLCVEGRHALNDFIRVMDGEAAIGFGGMKADWYFLLMLNASSPRQAEDNFKLAVTKLHQMLCASDMEAAQMSKPLPIPTFNLSENYSGTAIHHAELDSFLDYILPLHYAVLGNRFEVAAGPSGLIKLKGAIDALHHKPKTTNDQPILPKLDGDTVAVSFIHFLRLAGMDLGIVPPGIDIEKLSGDLVESPVTLSARLSKGLFALRLDIPANVPQSLFTLVQRAQNAAGIMKRQSQNPQNASAPDN